MRGEEKGVWEEWVKIEEIKYFINSIKSKETEEKYKSYFKKYLELTGLTVNDIVSEKDPRKIERQIIDLIIKLDYEGKSWGGGQFTTM